MKNFLSALALTAFFASTAHAGNCVISVTRYACPGMEKECYSKCGGRQSCDTPMPAASAAECASKALSACDNKRYDITKYKLIRAKFDGVDVGGGMDFCDKDSGSYKVVEHFPYRNAEQCR